VYITYILEFAPGLTPEGRQNGPPNFLHVGVHRRHKIWMEEISVDEKEV